MPKVERADQSKYILKISGLNIENCDSGEVFETNLYTKILEGNVWAFAWYQGWMGIDVRPV